MGYIGTPKDRITIAVELVNDYEYKDFSFSYYGDTRHIYTMKDEDGNLLVWKTGSVMWVKTGTDRFGDDVGEAIHRGDKVTIKATVKEHSVYKEQEQTVITRVKVIERTHRAPTWEELADERKKAQEQKAKEQRESLKGGDFIWHMPYRQYKEHYPDCETVAGSYCEKTGKVDVIIREGRLKPSGTRGKRYGYWEFKYSENGKEHRIVYYAISEETARRRLEKEYPNKPWELGDVHYFW